jgi:large subunit ribosomal protein L5
MATEKSKSKSTEPAAAKASAEKAASKSGAAKAPKAAKAAATGKLSAGPSKTAAAAAPEQPPQGLPRLLQMYRDEVTQTMMKEFNYDNVMQVPRVTKITLNIGLGQAVANPNLLKTAVDELTTIAGQKAVITKAKKAIANFKLREGLGIGCMVTLRKRRMWEFLERLQSVAMPRIRDFKGMNGKGFDGHGNYNGGLKDQTMFPEIVYEKVDLVKGMNFTVATTAKTDEEGKALLKHLGMPFRN